MTKRNIVATKGKNLRACSLPATPSTKFSSISTTHSMKAWNLPGTSFMLRVARKNNPNSTAMKHRRSLYFPRAAASGVVGDAAWLELTFAHATVRFEIAPDGDELAIGYEYRALPLRELRLAIPLLLWRGATATVDGAPLPEATGPRQAAAAVELTPVKHQVRVTTPIAAKGRSGYRPTHVLVSMPIRIETA